MCILMGVLLALKKFFVRAAMFYYRDALDLEDLIYEKGSIIDICGLETHSAASGHFLFVLSLIPGTIFSGSGL